MLSEAMAKRLMARTAAVLHTLEDVRDLQAKFQWQRDTSYGYPTIIEVFQKSVNGMIFPGDCATAAVLGKWSLGIIGIPATIYFLLSDTEPIGHTICVSDDHRIVIGNVSVVEIEPGDTWQANVFALWNGAYNRMDAVG